MQEPVGSVDEGFLPVSGGRIWYQVITPGKGIPLLTLHGGPGSPHDYLEPLAGLADERPVIFYDQLGCGRSERPEDRTLWQRDRFIEELGQVRQTLHLEKVFLFGHSWGSLLAVEYALTRPDGLMGLLLASPVLSLAQWCHDMEIYRQTLPVAVQKTLEEEESKGTTDSEVYQQAAMEFYRRYLCRLYPWPEPLERTIAGEGTLVYQTMWGPSEFSVTGNLRDYDCTAHLSKIADMPILLTCGRYDEATPNTTTWYQSLLPQAELVIFEQSAHMPHLEETERYLHVIRNFLRRIELVSGKQEESEQCAQ